MREFYISARSKMRLGTRIPIKGKPTATDIGTLPKPKSLGLAIGKTSDIEGSPPQNKSLSVSSSWREPAYSAGYSLNKHNPSTDSVAAQHKRASNLPLPCPVQDKKP